MHKKLAIPALALALLAMPFVASAASLSSTQISAIVSLLQAFDAPASVVSNVEAVLSGSSPSMGTSTPPWTAWSPGMGTSTPPSTSCITHNLSMGMTDAQSGGQVSLLQQFLGISPTGYFGSQTQAAVQSWQSSHSIVSSGSPSTTGFGFFGPRTRAAFGCGTQPPPPPPSTSTSTPPWTTWNPGSGSSTPPVAPVISGMAPTSGPVGTQVTLTGTFAPGGNVILFGNGAIRNAFASPSVYGCPIMTASSTGGCGTGGESLTFTVPQSIGPYCAPGTPCPLYMMLVQPGPYPVSVQNQGGTSTAMTFTVTATSTASSTES